MMFSNVNDSSESDSDSSREETVTKSKQTRSSTKVSSRSTRTPKTPVVNNDLLEHIDLEDDEEDVSSKPAASSQPAPKTFSKYEKLLSKSLVLRPDFDTLNEIPSRKTDRQEKRLRQMRRSQTAGGGWFDLAAPEMTEERKRDLQLLQMRQALDPKRFYKRTDRDTLPKHFQVGTVVEHAADFYHARVPRKQRKQTIVEEILNDPQVMNFQKRKLNELEAAKPLKRRPKTANKWSKHKTAEEGGD